MNATAKLTGITAGAGQCQCCGRAIRVRRFAVRYPDGATATLGRACAAKATGYSVTLVERMAAAEARAEEMAAVDRAAGLTWHDMAERAYRGGSYGSVIEASRSRQVRGWYVRVYGVEPSEVVA